VMLMPSLVTPGTSAAAINDTSNTAPNTNEHKPEGTQKGGE
jgi:hypothetical protein